MSKKIVIIVVVIIFLLLLVGIFVYVEKPKSLNIERESTFYESVCRDCDSPDCVGTIIREDGNGGLQCEYLSTYVPTSDDLHYSTVNSSYPNSYLETTHDCMNQTDPKKCANFLKKNYLYNVNNHKAFNPTAISQSANDLNPLIIKSVYSNVITATDYARALAIACPFASDKCNDESYAFNCAGQNFKAQWGVTDKNGATEYTSPAVCQIYTTDKRAERPNLKGFIEQKNKNGNILMYKGKWLPLSPEYVRYANSRYNLN